MQKTWRVVIADDHPVARSGVAAVVDTEGDMEVVAQVRDGSELLEIFRLLLPDVAVVDLGMPGMDGLQAIKAIKHEFPHARFVVFSMNEGDQYIRQALDAGAGAYLSKSAVADDMVKAIRAVARGERYLSEDAEKNLARHADDKALSGREQDILELLAKGLTNREIGEQLGMTEGTVRWYVRDILKRLKVSSRTQAVAAALQRGLIKA